MKLGLRYGGMAVAVVGVVLLVVGLLAGPPPPEGEASYRLSNKDRVISGVYKIYGVEEAPVPMWLAKTVFTNESDGRITDLRIRYRVTRYADSDWQSWHPYPAVDPGQTVVDLYHPLFSNACAELTSRTPADLQIEGEYVDAAGEKQTFSDSRRITMLNRQEFIFSDLTAAERTNSFYDTAVYAPLIAAWTSQNDAPVARLAAMANKRAGGLGAQTDDKSCLRVMAELYKVMRTIHISYQHPQVMADKAMSYDIKSVQSLQYPRQTIEKRSGTCVDLAILYASMLNAVSIKPYLVVMDGHCFPMGRAPSGALVPVESTMVGDGYERAGNFEKAVQAATKTWQEVQKSGRYYAVDVQAMWTQGINNPELPPLPADILEKWGIVKLVEQGGDGTPTPGGNGGGAVRPGGIAGAYALTVTSSTGQTVTGKMQVQAQGNQVQLTATANYRTMLADGMMHQIQEKNVFVGTLAGNQLQATCNQATWWVDGQQVPAQGLPFRLALTFTQNGRAARGQVGNALGTTATVIMQKQ